MPLIGGDMTTDGAIITVLVGVSKLYRQRLTRSGQAIPKSIAVRAQIDPGSFATAFMPSVFANLGIKPIGKIAIRTPSTKPGEPSLCDQYDVEVSFVSGMDSYPFPSVRVIESGDFLQDEEVQALIGRDILDRCVFQYYGPDRQYSISF